MKRLYFCRHGLSEHNKAGIYSGQTETPLSEEGREQAREAGRDAQRFAIDYIICSPYERALETARLIAAEIGFPVANIITDQDLVERHFGSLEGTPWTPNRDVDDEPGVESPADLQARVQRAYERLRNLNAQNILIVSHGSTGRMLRHVIDETIPFTHPDASVRGKYRLANAQIVQLI